MTCLSNKHVIILQMYFKKSLISSLRGNNISSLLFRLPSVWLLLNTFEAFHSFFLSKEEFFVPLSWIILNWYLYCVYIKTNSNFNKSWLILIKILRKREISKYAIKLYWLLVSLQAKSYSLRIWKWNISFEYKCWLWSRLEDKR